MILMQVNLDKSLLKVSRDDGWKKVDLGLPFFVSFKILSLKIVLERHC